MPQDILTIIKNEYISFLIILFLFTIYTYLNYKLKDVNIFLFLGNINQVPLLQSILFFLIFQIIDYIYEDGFIAMIKLWIVYWLYAIIALLLTRIINFYKNIKHYNIKLFFKR